jgi:uncharacterized membrane protein YozB (DUF420 family)
MIRAQRRLLVVLWVVAAAATAAMAVRMWIDARESILDHLPAANAVLNGTSAVLLLAAYTMIRRGRYRAHGILMVSAVAVSVAFLTSYVILHANRPPKSFTVEAGLVRGIYFPLLISHSILAVLIVPMVAFTLYRAAKRRWDRHARLARRTLPVWLYVSATGVVIYWMLYRMGT